MLVKCQLVLLLLYIVQPKPMVSKKDIVVYGYGSVAWKDRMEEWSNDGGFGDDFEDVDFPCNSPT